MSQEQANNFRLVKFLLLQLKSYGLNPADWKIDRRSPAHENSIFLVNREDRNFKFHGNLGVKNGVPGWKNLTLVSL